MFNNVKAKKRLTQVIISFIVICMTLTGSFLLLEDSVDTVLAADRTVESQAEWDNVMTEAAAGGTWTVTLGKTIEFAGKLKAIPAGATVNLRMNNCNIIWDVESTSFQSVIEDSYTSGKYYDGTFWGFLTNHGTLNISGTGTIRNKKLEYSNDGDNRTWLVAKSATIVNTGNLTVGGNVTIESYLSYADMGSTRKTAYVYNAAIYNEGGTVTSSGNITAASLVATPSGQNPGHRYSFAYGIYDGVVNLKGGAITVDSYAGGLTGFNGVTGSNRRACHMYSAAVGVYSNTFTAFGNTTIKTITKNWETNTGTTINLWQDGIDHMFSVGVLRKTTGSVPVIGPSVDILSSFEHIFSDDGHTIYVPGTSKDAYFSGCKSDDSGSDNTSHIATPVTAVSSLNYNIGAHRGSGNEEKNYSNKFFGGTTPWESIGNGADANRQYRTAQAYFSGDDATETAPQLNNDGSKNQHIRKTASIVNGAPGNDNTGSPVGNPGNGGSIAPGVLDGMKKGSQYLVVYRYYRDFNNIESVSFRADSTRINGSADITVGGVATKKGIVTDGDAKIAVVNKPAPKNGNYFDAQTPTRYETILSAGTTSMDSITDRLNGIVSGNASNPSLWAGQKNTLDDNGVSVATKDDNVIVIYIDYKMSDASPITVVASNNAIDTTTKETSFSVTYKGSTIVPGVDFQLGIISTDATGNNRKVATDRYDISNNDSSKVNVIYKHKAENSTGDFVNGLPKDVGVYTIEVTVAADAAYSENSLNLQAKTATITGTIKKANVDISGHKTKSGVYGSAYNVLIPTDDYDVTGKGADVLEGKLSFAGLDENSVPVAGSSSVNLVWTPTKGTESERNYNITTFSVQLDVAKKTVHVNAGVSSVPYGDSKPKYAIEYVEDLADCDKPLMTEYLNNSTFVVKNPSGEYVPYDVTKWVPEVSENGYDMQIGTFGGAGNENYTFIINEKVGKLDVTKRNIEYFATAIDRTYDKDAGNTVDVVLKYLSGNLAGSDYYDVINTTGEMKDANAGNGKLVTVNTESVVVANSKNYQLSINNASDVRVNIAKATPTGVKVVAYPDTVVYDSTATLNAVALNVVESSIEGSWIWKQNDEGKIPTPTVDKGAYTAVFTPADKNNYLSLEQDVKLTVQQKEVKVSVKDPKTNAPYVISYGDSVPPISGSISYDGFTGNHNISNIGVNGRVDATTGYTRGSAAGKYAVNVISDLTATNYYFTAVPTEITVAKKTLTVTAANQSVTFGGPVPELNVTDLSFDGFYNTENYTDLGGTVVVTTTYTPGASVGEYKVTANGYTSDNYEIVYVDGVLTVNKAVLTVVPDNVAGVKYGADAPDYTGKKLYKFVDTEGHTVTTAVTGEPVFTTQYKSGRDAGTYPVTVSVNAMSATNYSFVGQEGSLTVGKADPKIIDAAGATVINTHKFSEAKFDGTEKVVNPYNETMTVEGKFAFVDADREARWGDDGLYEVVFTPDDTHNYNSVTTKTLLEILEKVVTGKPVIRGSAMEGSTLTLVLDSMDPNVKDYYAIEWYKDNVKLSGSDMLDYTLTADDIGSVFKVKLIPDADQGFSDGGNEIWSDATSMVIEALLETTAAQFKAMFEGVEYNTLGASAVFSNVEYDDFRHPVTVEIADAYKTAVFAEDYVVKYNGVAEAPVNAGTYIVTIDIGTPAKPDGGYTNNTYGPATGIVLGKLEITKATLDISIAVQDKIYDGTTSVNATVFEPIGKKDEMDDVWFASGAKFTFADPNVGQDKEIKVTSLSLNGEDAGNYQINPELNVTANILPRTIYFEAINAEKDYDGTRDVTVSFRYAIDANEPKDVGYAAVDSMTSVYPINGMASAESADAGKRNLLTETMSCVLAGSSAKNYVPAFVSTDAVVTIKKINPVVEAPEINGGSYNAARPLSALNSLLGTFNTEFGSWLFVNDTTVPTVSQKKYKARYYPADKTNYNEIEKDVIVNIEPLEVVIWPEDTVITYGSKSPVIKIGPEVLPDGTPLASIGGSCTPIHDYYTGAPVTSEPYIITLNNAFHDDNYKFTTMTGTLTVIPARLNVVAVAKDKVFDGTSDIEVNFTIVSGKYGNDDVSLSHSTTIGQSMTPNAGQTTVEYTAPYLVGAKADNYEIAVTPASRVLPVTISKANVAGVVFPVDATVEFGYDLRYAQFAIDGIGDGTFAFKNAKDIIPPAVDFYEYTVVFTPTDSRNYNTQERVVSLEVVKCVLDYIVGVAGTPQQGQTLAVVFTGLPAHAEPYVQYQWYRMNGSDAVAIPGATSAKYVATEDDIGYTLAVVTYVDEAQAPFVYAEGACEDGFGESDIRCVVAVSDSAIKEITLTFWQRLLDWIRRVIAALTGVKLNGGLGG